MKQVLNKVIRVMPSISFASFCIALGQGKIINSIIFLGSAIYWQLENIIRRD